MQHMRASSWYALLESAIIFAGLREAAVEDTSVADFVMPLANLRKLGFGAHTCNETILNLHSHMP